MRRVSILLLLLFFLSNAAFPGKVDIYKRPEQFERSRDYDALHYKLEFKFDVKKKTYWGQNTITLLPLRDNFRECKLDAEDFTVTAVYGPEKKPLPFKQTDKHLFVTLTREYKYKEKVSFVVTFFEKNPKSGLRFIDAAAGHPAQINTYSWPEEAHHWFPCFDFPNDKVTNELAATVKNDYKALSNGKLVRITEDKKNKTKTYYWHQDLPHPTCLIMLAAGPYEIIEDSFGSLPVNYWVYKKDVTNAKRTFKKTPAIIDFFNKTFGFDYPWAKYDQVCAAGHGGGIENTTAASLGHRIIRDVRAEKDFPADDLIAHELAHQWWGNTVTERTWSHVWLSESFATYSQYLFLCFDQGQEEGAVDLLAKKNRYLREAAGEYIRPLVFNRYEKPWNILDAHSYPKGAVILHMLRFVMGDKAFFRSLSHFLKKHAFQSVDTHDFQIAIKEAAGQNLDWFFEQWAFKPGHPVFDIAYDWDENTGKLKLKVKQIQDTSKGVPVFRLPVIFEIVTPGGTFSRKIWLTKKEEEFEFAAAQEPLLVRFDKGNYLLKEWTFSKTLEELLFQLENDDITGKMWAAAELYKFKSDHESLAALIESARKDPSRHVRAAAVEILGKLKRPDLTQFFKTCCEDRESLVRAASIKALGDFEKAALAPFFKARFKRDRSYLVQAEALAAIGKSGNKSHIPFLKKAAKIKYPGIVKRAAERALKNIKERPKFLDN